MQMNCAFGVDGCLAQPPGRPAIFKNKLRPARLAYPTYAAHLDSGRPLSIHFAETV